MLAGCLRVSKESIFTGLNNFKVYSADDVQYDEEFGFTTEDVKKILADYNQQDHFEEMKEGKYADGEKVLRAKIDMASPNMNMRDPVIYRVAHIPTFVGLFERPGDVAMGEQLERTL